MLAAGANAVRFANAADLDEYLGIGSMATPFTLLESTRSRAASDVDLIGRDEAFEETLFLGLRLNEGVDINSLRDQFGDAMLRDAMPALLEVRDAGLLELSSNRIRLTQRGRLVSNEVFSRLLIPTAA
jgi:oxygen-independent coproporphyrinogen-3 oxidase